MRRLTIKNTSRIPDEVVRALLDVAREVVWDSSRLDVGIAIKNRTRGPWSGHAYRNRIVASVGPDSAFPITAKYPGLSTAPEYTVNDATEAVCALLAHELTHVRQLRAGRRASEIECEHACIHALERLRTKDRPGVDAAWAAAKARLATEAAVAEAAKAPEAKAARRAESTNKRREARLAKLLESQAKWTRKLKLAQTKLRGVKRKLAAADRRAAARPSK